MRELVEGARALGITLAPEQVQRFERYYQVLVDANRQTNLTRITRRDEVQTLHFLDSLTCLLAIGDLLERLPDARLVDVGSGAGFPGVPLALVCPSLRVTLLDSLRKRTAFLERLVAELGLERVAVVTARAEEAGRAADHRERYDIAVARALAPLPVLLELCLPLVRVGGRLVAPRKGDLAAEVTASEYALAELGGGQPSIIGVDLPGLRDGRALVVVEKAASTPLRYPRRPGIPAKRPLARPGAARG